MGFFSPSSTTVVASVAYNLSGGDLGDPTTNYLRTSTINGVLSDVSSLGEHIVKAQFAGPSFNDRKFLRWAKRNYDEGFVTGSLESRSLINAQGHSTISQAIAAQGESRPITVTTAFTYFSDIFYFAERYLLANDPATYLTQWGADWDPDTDRMTLFYEDGSNQVFAVADFVSDEEYLYAYYEVEDVDEAGEPVSIPLVFIYRLNTGNVALDGLAGAQSNSTSLEFYPIIPLRTFNKPIDHPDFANEFSQFEKAFERMTGSEISEILESIEENESIDDIDHAFLVMGSELNTTDVAATQYIYTFMKELIGNQEMSAEDFQDYLDDPSGSDIKTTTINIKSLSQTVKIPYSVTLSWVTALEREQAGLGKAGAKKGDFWWEVNSQIADPQFPPSSADDQRSSVTRFRKDNTARLYWQVSATTHKYIEIYDFVHTNRVYKSKTVRIEAADAIKDDDLSGFVIPMSASVVKQMPITVANEFSMANKIVVFNSYEVVKQKWYETGIFKVVIGVVLVLGAVTLFPGSAAAATGIFGSHVAVGTALGLSGTAALVAGATVNVIAGMVISNIISQASVEIFGEELGQVVALVATLYVSAELSGGEFNWAAMSRADQLLALTNVVSRGVVAYAQGEVKDIAQEMEAASEQYDEDLEKIMELYEDLGYTGAVIDPMIFTDLGNSSLDQVSRESRPTFIKRSLLTGSDIVEMSHSMVEDFPRFSLALPNAQK